jgi:hypothetical protein
MANMIARLGVLLGLDGAEFERGIQRAERSLTDFASKAVNIGGIVATAFAATSAALTRVADEIDDVAKANDVTIDTILRLNNALEQSGGSAENAGKMLSSFSSFIEKAAGGSKEAQDRLKNLGISLEDLASLPVDQLFRRVVQGLADIDDALIRAGAGKDIFGKAFNTVSIRDFNEELENAASVSDRTSAGIRELAEANDMMAKSARQLGVTIMSELGGPFKTLLEYIQQLKDTDDLLIKFLRGLVNHVIGSIGTLAFFGKVALDALTGLGQAASAIIAGNFTQLSKIWEQTKEKFANDFAQYKQFVADLNKSSYGEKSVEIPKSTQRAVIDAEEENRKKALAKLVEQQWKDAERRAEQARREEEQYFQMLQRNADAMDKMQRDEQERLQTMYEISQVESQIGVLTQQEIERRKEMIMLAHEHNRALNKIYDTQLDNDARQRALTKEDQIHTQRVALAEQKLANTQAANANSLRISQNLQRDRLELEKELLLVDANFGRKRAEEVTHARELLQIEFDRKKAIEEIQRMNISEAEKTAAIQRENENAASRAELANTKLEIARAKREGTFMEGFKNKMFDAVRDLPTELERGEQFFESVMSNMENALSNFIKTGKLNFKDFARSIIQDLLMIQMRAQMVSIFKSFLGDYDPAQASGVAKFFSGLAGRADGGPISANTPYLVGERGPELVVPRSAGVVIPNQRMSGVGGVSNVTNNYIQAIDTKSFEERIYGSASAVWAANQFASRAMPTAPGRI